MENVEKSRCDTGESLHRCFLDISRENEIARREKVNHIEGCRKCRIGENCENGKKLSALKSIESKRLFDIIDTIDKHENKCSQCK